jgi:hypothetical protein
LNEKGKEKKQYGLFDMGAGSIDTLTLAELKRRNELSMQYVFDLRNNRFLKIELIDEGEALPRKAYPLTADERGLPPDQFDARAHVGDPLIAHDHAAGLDDDEDDDGAEEEEYYNIS